MRGQATEYILVFAAVVAISIIVVALGLSEFPYMIFDSQAVILGQIAGYEETLESFRDGALSLYSAEYNASAGEVEVILSVIGWDETPVRQAVATVMNNYGYRVRWV